LDYYYIGSQTFAKGFAAAKRLENTALKKTDPEMFSFWVNDIAAKRQDLFYM